MSETIASAYIGIHSGSPWVVTVKNGVYGNPIFGCSGNTGCTTPHGVFPSHLEEVFSYTPVHPSLYQMGCCDTPMSKFYYTPIRAHNAPNMVLLILYQWGVVILP